MEKPATITEYLEPLRMRARHELIRGDVSNTANIQYPLSEFDSSARELVEPLGMKRNGKLLRK